MEPKDKTLLEKEVMCLEISATEISGMLKNQQFLTDKKLENDSAAKLFSRFNLDFNYASGLQSSPSCKGSAYSFMLKEKPIYTSGFDIAVNRLENPLGSIYGSLFGSSSYGLPCDLGLMRR